DTAGRRTGEGLHRRVGEDQRQGQRHGHAEEKSRHMSRKIAKRPAKKPVKKAKRPSSNGTPAQKVGWFFASNDGGEDKGLNDAGVVTFKGNIYRYLAREIIQNSLDAR